MGPETACLGYSERTTEAEGESEDMGSIWNLAPRRVEKFFLKGSWGTV